MMSVIPYRVSAFWDAEAEVWVAESEDVPGLATEAKSMEQLTCKLKQIVPELLVANHLVVLEEKGVHCSRRFSLDMVLIGFSDTV
jgi:predicted RNase H-like HicB family nuclease